MNLFGAVGFLQSVVILGGVVNKIEIHLNDVIRNMYCVNIDHINLIGELCGVYLE